MARVPKRTSKRWSRGSSARAISSQVEAPDGSEIGEDKEKRAQFRFNQNGIESGACPPAVDKDLSRSDHLRFLEAGRRMQAGKIEDGDTPLVERGKAFVPDALEHTVDVNCGQAEHIGQLLLRERAGEDIALRETDWLKAMVNLRDEVCDPAVRVAAAEADQPRTKDAGLGIPCPIPGALKHRQCTCCDAVLAQYGDTRGSGCTYVLSVVARCRRSPATEIARQQDIRYLARAVAPRLRTIGPALDQKVEVKRGPSAGGQRPPARHRQDLDDGVDDCAAVFSAEGACWRDSCEKQLACRSRSIPRDRGGLVPRPSNFVARLPGSNQNQGLRHPFSRKEW